MKLLHTFFFLLLSVIGLSQNSSGLTAEQILDSSIAFSGGEKRIASIESSTINYLLVQPDQSTAIITEKRRTGQKYVQSILSKTHVPQTTFYDGKKLSRVDGESVIQIAEIAQIEEIKLKTYNLVQYGYKRLHYELTRLPDKKFQNFDCYVVDAKASNGYTTMNFFDKRNYRLLMVVYPNGDKSLMIDFILKDSVLFNSHIINTFANSDELQDLSLQHIDTKGAISDLWFNCPYKDKVYVPKELITGRFGSTNGEKTIFTRTNESQDYEDENGKVLHRRFLKWASGDTYGLIDEKAIRDNIKTPESEILVRIISWSSNEYVCHWIAGKYTDTQDYKLIK
jgi:hypothetical protein